MAYYYLISSLTAVSMDTKPDIPVERFISLCVEHLAPEDMLALETAMAAPSGASPGGFAGAWLELDTQLRNALVLIRAERMDKDEAPFLRPAGTGDGIVEKTAAAAMARENPVEREQVLDGFRWSMIEELAGFDPFSADAVVAYGLKLQIAHKWAAMNDNKGREAFEAILTASRPGLEKDARP